jgi:hypothetical protein
VVSNCEQVILNGLDQLIVYLPLGGTLCFRWSECHNLII